MEYLINILDKPLLSLAEASRIMNCSKQTVKRRIEDGFIKCASRHGMRGEGNYTSGKCVQRLLRSHHSRRNAPLLGKGNNGKIL